VITSDAGVRFNDVPLHARFDIHDNLKVSLSQHGEAARKSMDASNDQGRFAINDGTSSQFAADRDYGTQDTRADG
jgi:hypothetical protein